jgi:hypothetical protein
MYLHLQLTWGGIHEYIHMYTCVIYIHVLYVYIDRKKPPPPGGFPIYYVPSSRTMCKRTPLEGFVPGSSRGVLLHTVLDEGT